MAREPARKLAGWKEVAEYLGTSPRTVQRWEHEKGLPVHRVPGSNGHSVFANSEELDRWFASGAPVGQSVAGLAGSEPASAEVSHSQARSGDLTTAPQAGGSVWLAARRYSPLRVAALAALVVAVALGAGLVRARSARWRTSAVFHTAEPAGSLPSIVSVTSIQPKADQVIVVKGQGLGTHCYYANEDVPFLAIRDKTARWAAGRIIPENWDEVTLNVALWTDSEIVVTGFAGAYGQHWWKLNPGDQIEVAVWNPQTQSGPATFELTVGPASEVTKR